MSVEAIQAITETRNEMKKETELKDQQNNSLATNENAENNKKNNGDNYQMHDHDSAIGTSSMKSQHMVTKEQSLSVEEMQIPADKPLVEQSPERNTGAAQTLPKDEFEGKSSGRRPATACANSPLSVGRKDVQDYYQSSQWIQSYINKHKPAMPNEQTKKMNVFERLSAPSQISYRISARQRARARLSIVMNSTDRRNELLAFNQRREPHKETCKSPFPTITRLQKSFDFSQLSNKKEQNIKSRLPLHYNYKQTIRTTPTIEKQTLIRRKSIEAKQSGTQTRPTTTPIEPLPVQLTQTLAEEKPTSVVDDKASEVSIKILGIDGLNAMGPFEITPEGYDSRYSAVKNAQNFDWDQEDCEIIRQSKIKCRQWLEQQMAILSKYSAHRI